MKNDETASVSQYIAAAPHYLESWGDLETKKGHFGLMQPTIRPLFDTKQFQEVLLELLGDSGSYHDFVKSYWKRNVLNGTSWNDSFT